MNTEDNQVYAIFEGTKVVNLRKKQIIDAQEGSLDSIKSIAAGKGYTVVETTFDDEAVKEYSDAQLAKDIAEFTDD